MDHERNKVKGFGYEGLVAGVEDVGGTHAVWDDSRSAVDGGPNRNRDEGAVDLDLTPEVLAWWEELAVKHAAAYEKMLEYGKGVGGLGSRHPGMFADMLAWDDASDDDHADMVLALLSGVRSRDARIAELEAVIAEASKLAPWAFGMEEV